MTLPEPLLGSVSLNGSFISDGRSAMRIFFLIALILLGPAHESAAAAETYELLFHSAALKGLEAEKAGNGDPKGGLVYDKVVSGVDSGERSGRFAVGLKVQAGDNVSMTLNQGSQSRGLGNYPRSVGNPLIMYFLESVLSDLAAQSGGSPFYMRNRIKEALLRDAQIEPVMLRYNDREIAAREVTIRPFEHDKAREKMGRVADLSLAVTVSEDVPGWYFSLVATIPSAADSSGAGYSHAITLRAPGSSASGEDQP
ncbi:hypothetical protein GOC59_04385 [Sinorhizobium medicae]|nr:hypothetical protein [Sinorhizobium medicae]MDX0717839.1 hypothetical protein [Sinorhizobium medicae]MDX0998667.1 hypothetical protein [Sinorhizobium medicae]MDX1182603.1 hypothetical protein [Sinorhizobium medicae]